MTDTDPATTSAYHLGTARLALGILTMVVLVMLLDGCASLQGEPKNQSPSVEFLSPPPGTVVTVGEEVAVEVHASDPDGTLRVVTLEINGDDSNPPAPNGEADSFVARFTPQSAGTLYLVALVQDDDGAWSLSQHTLVAQPAAAPEPPTEPPAEGSAFSIVVIPDTQNMIEDPDNAMTDQMTQWIASRAEELNLAFVTHLGDIVSYGHRLSEWNRADAALRRLDGLVPYSIALGDHDYEIEEDMASSTENYVTYFGPQRYADYDWYGGSGPGGKSHYQYFQAAGRTFLHIALEWEAPGPVTDPSTPLGWARTVLEAHPQLPTIISTHAYIWDQPGLEGRFPDSELEGFIEDAEGNVDYPGTSGEGIFDALVEPFPQVFMVLNGHYHKADGTDQGEFHQVSENSAGFEVYEMLSNYQSYPDGGQGFLRIIQFIPQGGEAGLDRIAVQTYSPVLDEYQTDTRSRFHFDLSFDSRWPLD